MARIAGIDLPKNKRGEIGLTYIFGIGRSTAQYILTKAGIDFNKKVNKVSSAAMIGIARKAHCKYELIFFCFSVSTSIAYLFAKPLSPLFFVPEALLAFLVYQAPRSIQALALFLNLLQ